jgi:2,3-bisphosphoglycerate-independent phosphoglycerate mutase
MRTFQDAREGAGLTHDIDGATARGRGLDVPEHSAEEAARIFWALAQDFTLFEHYLADEAGHAKDFEAAVRALTTFDGFARAVIAQRPDDAQIFICSDHGNVEDLSTRSHTTHPVPVLAFGPADASRISNVADVGAEVLRLLGAT